MARDNEAARLWTCSAGYGLIRAKALIHPYAATFAPGHKDSVGADSTRWWQRLGEWSGRDPGQPRTIRTLVQRDPGAVFLLMLSAPYLLACQDDIRAAIDEIADPDQFMVISAGTRQLADLSKFLLPADARLQAHLGGTLQALNVRIGEHLLSAGIRTRSDAIANLRVLLNSQPQRKKFGRKKLDDDDVMSLIAGGLVRSPGASASKLLREFRDQGYACEQGRFSQLHRRLMEEKSS